MILKQFIVGFLVTILSISVLAQGPDDGDDDDDDDDDEFSYALGIFASSEQSIYVGGKDNVQVYPLLRARWGHFFFEGATLGVDLYRDDTWTISASVSPDFGSSDRDDSSQLDDMQDHDDAFLGQINIGHEADWGEVELSLGRDISNTHDGYSAELSYAYGFPVGGWLIEPEVGIEWFSEEISQYNYGVVASDVRSGRPLYEPGSGVNYGVGISATYPFLERHALLIQVEYTSFSSEITDSPIVDRDNSAEIGVGYLYQF